MAAPGINNNTQTQNFCLISKLTKPFTLPIWDLRSTIIMTTKLTSPRLSNSTHYGESYRILVDLHNDVVWLEEILTKPLGSRNIQELGCYKRQVEKLFDLILQSTRNPEPFFVRHASHVKTTEDMLLALRRDLLVMAARVRNPPSTKPEPHLSNIVALKAHAANLFALLHHLHVDHSESGQAHLPEARPLILQQGEKEGEQRMGQLMQPPAESLLSNGDCDNPSHPPAEQPADIKSKQPSSIAGPLPTVNESVFTIETPLLTVPFTSALSSSIQFGLTMDIPKETFPEQAREVSCRPSNFALMPTSPVPQYGPTARVDEYERRRAKRALKYLTRTVAKVALKRPASIDDSIPRTPASKKARQTQQDENM